MRLNSELFPTLGRPTHPILRLDLTRPKATTLFVVASVVIFFGGMINYFAGFEIDRDLLRRVCGMEGSEGSLIIPRDLLPSNLFIFMRGSDKVLRGRPSRTTF